MIQLSLEYFPPLFNLALRFLVAALAILMLMKMSKIQLTTDARSIKIYFILAIFSFTIPFWLVYWAEKHIPSSLASILFGMFPFFVAILSNIFIKEEKLTALKFSGISIAFIGLIIIFNDGLKIEPARLFRSRDADGLEFYFVGMTLVVLSALMQASIAVYIKKQGGHLNPLSMNFVPAMIAAVILIIASFFFEDFSSVNFTVLSSSYIIYLALIVTVFNFTTYYWLMKRISVVILSLTSFITPIIAIFLGWILHGEKLTTNILFGSFFVLIGIIIVNWYGIRNYYNQRITNNI